MMQFAVEVTQGKHKQRGRLIAGKADDHAVRGASTFDLNPLAPPGPVVSVCSLCHNAFEAGNSGTSAETSLPSRASFLPSVVMARALSSLGSTFCERIRS